MTNILEHPFIAETVGGLYRYRRDATPDLQFLRFDEHSYTYREFDQFVSQIRGGLQAAHLVKGDRIGCFLLNSPLQVAMLIACALEGMIWAPLNAALVGADLSTTLRDLDPSLILVDEEALAVVRTAALPGVCVVVVRHDGVLPAALKSSPATASVNERLLVDLAEWVSQPADESIEASIRPGDPLAIIYSGGTTGTPKGIVLPHFYGVSAALRLGEVAKFGERETFFTALQLYHGWSSLTVLTFCIYYGHTFAFWRWWSASRWFDTAKQYEATIVDPYIGMVGTLLSQPPPDKPREHQIKWLFGAMGGKESRAMELRKQFEDLYGIPTFQMYALTESGPLASTEWATEPRRFGSSGRPRGWYEVGAVDDDGMPLPPGETGELVVRPLFPGLMALRYHGRPEQTLESWRDLWIHTGDLGYVDGDGYVYYTGRSGWFARRLGELVALDEVEQVARAYPGIKDVAAVAVPSHLGEDDIKLCVVTSAPMTAQEIETHCRSHLARFKVPRYVEIVDELPRSSTKQEIERHKLRDVHHEGVIDFDKRPR